MVQDGKVRITKRAASLSHGGKYALPGGFMSRDETLAEGAARETLEETGYKVRVTKLFKITDQPNRKGEDRQNVNVSFLAEVEEKVNEPDDEVSGVKWFELENLPKEEEFAGLGRED